MHMVVSVKSLGLMKGSKSQKYTLLNQSARTISKSRKNDLQKEETMKVIQKPIQVTDTNSSCCNGGGGGGTGEQE